jgi:hypothetical protein
MRRFITSARIVTEKGEDAIGLMVTLQIFKLAAGKWTKLASAKTTERGNWSIKGGLQVPDDFFSPALRLVEEGTPAPRILAQQCVLSYNAREQVLSADFGVIERLGERAHTLIASREGERSKHVIAGQPKRAEERPVSTEVRSRFDAEILKFQAREAELHTTNIRLNRQIEATHQELSGARSRIEELHADLSTAERVKAELIAENQRLGSEVGRRAPIQHIAANIGTQVHAANQILRENQRPYQIGRIELDLKGTVSSDGETMTLANSSDLAKLKSGVNFPGVNMELLPQRDPPTESVSVTVPDVVGLTETAVRRLLQAVGLRLERVNKSVGEDSETPIGQSMQQSPVSGSDLPRNNTVLVVFAAVAPTSENDQ